MFYFIVKRFTLKKLKCQFFGFMIKVEILRRIKWLIEPVIVNLIIETCHSDSQAPCHHSCYISDNLTNDLSVLKLFEKSAHHLSIV